MNETQPVIKLSMKFRALLYRSLSVRLMAVLHSVSGIRIGITAAMMLDTFFSYGNRWAIISKKEALIG